MITRDLLISNLRSYYPKLSHETAQYEAKRNFAEKSVRQLQIRETMSRQDFWLCLWLALPNDNKFIRHMPMRERLQ